MIWLLTAFNSRFSLLKFKLELWGLKIFVLLLFRSVLGFRWPPKVVLSSGTSYKNRFFKQFTFTASSKLLLAPFLTLLTCLMTPKRQSQGGSTNHSFCLSKALRLFWDSVALRHLFPTPSDVDFCWFLMDSALFERNFKPEIHRFCCKTNSENTTLASTTPTSRHDNWRFLAFFATRYSGLFNESCRCPVRNWKTNRRNKQLILFVLKLCTCKFVHTQYG